MVRKGKIVLEGSMESSKDKFRREVKVKKEKVLVFKGLLKRLRK